VENNVFDTSKKAVIVFDIGTPHDQVVQVDNKSMRVALDGTLCFQMNRAWIANQVQDALTTSTLG
jgi:hypothetical protein